jgi:hypothetical protein
MHASSGSLGHWIRKARSFVRPAQVYGLKSVLILESNDIALSNVFEVGQAFKRALEGRSELPDLVFLIETEGVPLYGWLMKDGENILPRQHYFEDYCATTEGD